jgi:hypothetical protein
MNFNEETQTSATQASLFDVPSPSQLWDEDSAKHALDDLFSATQKYRSGSTYKDLIDFVRRFRFYSPYNSFLVHVQMPGARYVAPSYRWKKEYGRTIKPNANPVVILQPMGPVMFVFDVADTEPGPGAKPLPPEVDDPFAVHKGYVGAELDRTIENAKRDGIRILKQNAGSQAAGSIQSTSNQNLPRLQFYTGKDKDGVKKYVEVPVRYEMLYNGNLTREAAYVTIVHELAHLYCGHLGTPKRNWWPDRRGLDLSAREFEAESVAHLVYTRLGIKTPSDTYLSGYLGHDSQIPKISLESVMKAAGLIEDMGKKRLKHRKKD